MIPEYLNPADVTRERICTLAAKWNISPELAERLFNMAARAPFKISIISGWRSLEHQEQLRRAGRPTAANERSTHLSCPATGADLQLNVARTNVTKAQLGELARIAGLRWGGGSSVDPQTGIPSDWNHVDLGPRANS